MLTFAAFMAERFIPHVRETVRSHAEYETMARLRLTPTVGRLRLDEISPGHVASFRRKLIAEGLSNARVNRHLAVLRRAMNLALRGRVARASFKKWLGPPSSARLSRICRP